MIKNIDGLLWHGASVALAWRLGLEARVTSALRPACCPQQTSRLYQA